MSDEYKEETTQEPGQTAEQKPVAGQNPVTEQNPVAGQKPVTEQNPAAGQKPVTEQKSAEAQKPAAEPLQAAKNDQKQETLKQEKPKQEKPESGNDSAPEASVNGFSAKERLEQELSGLSVQREQMNRELADANRAMNRERENVIRDRRDGVAEVYEKQLKAVDKDLKAVTEKRQKVRNQGVEARISEQTQALSGENKELKLRLVNLFQDNHVPAICRTGFFYTFTMPRGLKEIGSAIVGFVAAFGILPMLMLFLLFGGGDGKRFWAFMLVYFVDIVIFGGLYVMLNSLKTKHLPVIREGRALRDRMRANQKQIAKIAREIRRDKNDALYDLQSFDDQLTRKSQEREEILQKKSQALEEFDAVTRNVLSDEVTEKHAPHIAELQARLGEMDAKIAAVEAQIRSL